MEEKVERKTKQQQEEQDILVIIAILFEKESKVPGLLVPQKYLVFCIHIVNLIRSASNWEKALIRHLTELLSTL